ncbi:tetratricopeptide repeat protein, partial [bacterium]|nr:tetratricopeptide repeat protein [bacterium]
FIRDKNGKTDKITMKVYVEQDYSKTYIPPKKHHDYFKEFKKYDYSKLPYNCLYALSQIYLSYEKIEEASKCFSVLKSKAKTDEEKYKFMKILSGLLIKTGKLCEAEKLYYEIIEKNPEKIENLLELAELEIEMEKTDEAKEQLDKIMKTKDEKLKRQAEIRMGDIYRIKGEGEKAKKIYEKYTDKKNYSMRNAFYAQQVIYNIKRKDFSTAEEKLKNWENEVPLAKIDSSWSLLKSRLFFLENRFDKALNEIDIFLKICSKNNPYIPYALFLKGKIFEKKGEKEKAEKIYKEIQKEYPEINLEITF